MATARPRWPGAEEQHAVKGEQKSVAPAPTEALPHPEKSCPLRSLAQQVVAARVVLAALAQAVARLAGAVLQTFAWQGPSLPLWWPPQRDDRC